jgi:hypothetical protein
VAKSNEVIHIYDSNSFLHFILITRAVDNPSLNKLMKQQSIGLGDVTLVAVLFNDSVSTVLVRHLGV